MDSYLAKKNADKRSQEICKNHEKDAILQKLSKEYFIYLPQNSNNNALQADESLSSVKFKRPASKIAVVSSFKKNLNLFSLLYK